MKKLTLSKKNSLKIQYSASQKAIAHWTPLKTFRWKGLSFICAFGLCLLIESNSLVKLSQRCSTGPWNDMWFLSLMKHHNYCHFGFMDVLKRHGHLCTYCKIHPQKGGKHVISSFRFVKFMKHQTPPWLCNWKPCLLSMNCWTRS